MRRLKHNIISNLNISLSVRCSDSVPFTYFVLNSMINANCLIFHFVLYFSARRIRLKTLGIPRTKKTSCRTETTKTPHRMLFEATMWFVVIVAVSGEHEFIRVKNLQFRMCAPRCSVMLFESEKPSILFISCEIIAQRYEQFNNFQIGHVIQMLAQMCLFLFLFLQYCNMTDKWQACHGNGF